MCSERGGPRLVCDVVRYPFARLLYDARWTPSACLLLYLDSERHMCNKIAKDRQKGYKYQHCCREADERKTQLTTEVSPPCTPSERLVWPDSKAINGTRLPSQPLSSEFAVCCTMPFQGRRASLKANSDWPGSPHLFNHHHVANFAIPGGPIAPIHRSQT